MNCESSFQWKEILKKENTRASEFTFAYKSSIYTRKELRKLPSTFFFRRYLHIFQPVSRKRRIPFRRYIRTNSFYGKERAPLNCFLPSRKNIFFDRLFGYRKAQRASLSAATLKRILRGNVISQFLICIRRTDSNAYSKISNFFDFLYFEESLRFDDANVFAKHAFVSQTKQITDTSNPGGRDLLLRIFRLILREGTRSTRNKGRSYLSN